MFRKGIVRCSNATRAFTWVRYGKRRHVGSLRKGFVPGEENAATSKFDFNTHSSEFDGSSGSSTWQRRRSGASHTSFQDVEGRLRRQEAPMQSIDLHSLPDLPEFYTEDSASRGAFIRPKVFSHDIRDVEHQFGDFQENRSVLQGVMKGKDHNQPPAEASGHPFPGKLPQTSTSMDPNESSWDFDSIPEIMEANPHLNDLPKSPLMDPSIVSAKSKPVRPPPSTSTLTDFQKQLLKNPYALALATPVRKCLITGTTIPSYFLQQFQLLGHPETGDPWYVPQFLVNNASTNLPSIYTLSNKSILESLEGPRRLESKRMSGNAKYPIPVRFWIDRFRRIKAMNKVLDNVNWRPDMHEHILELMRRKLVNFLVYLTNQKRGYVIGCQDWEDAKSKRAIGAYLWTGEGGGPGEFATFEMEKVGPNARKRKIPIHNLKMLLGEAKLIELREAFASGIFDREWIALKHRSATVDVQMLMWSLQGYLAEYKEVVGDKSKSEKKEKTARAVSEEEVTKEGQAQKKSQEFEEGDRQPFQRVPQAEQQGRRVWNVPRGGVGSGKSSF